MLGSTPETDESTPGILGSTAEDLDLSPLSHGLTRETYSFDCSLSFAYGHFEVNLWMSGVDFIPKTSKTLQILLQLFQLFFSL